MSVLDDLLATPVMAILHGYEPARTAELCPSGLGPGIRGRGADRRTQLTGCGRRQASQQPVAVMTCAPAGVGCNEPFVDAMMPCAQRTADHGADGVRRHPCHDRQW